MKKIARFNKGKKKNFSFNMPGSVSFLDGRYLRATISLTKKKELRVWLYQGNGHKDTMLKLDKNVPSCGNKKTHRQFQRALDIVQNHAKVIDRYNRVKFTPFPTPSYEQFILGRLFDINPPQIDEKDLHKAAYQRVEEAHKAATAEVQRQEDKLTLPSENLCGPDVLPWPYNVKDKRHVQGEAHLGPMWMNGQYINIVIDPITATLIIKCHDCGTELKRMKLDWDKIIGR